MRITYVIDTHVQADHRSGGKHLAEVTGARYALHASAPVHFTFFPLHDGQELDLGNVSLRVLHTPGHTPESICFLVTDKTRGPEPWFLLTGDTLFVGAVGRPDLPGREQEGAAALYESLHHKLLCLPKTLEIYPAHFSGSACDTGMGVYRLWRDSGYALGALLSGVVADLLGMRAAIHLVAALTLGSGVLVALVMRETRQREVEPQG